MTQSNGPQGANQGPVNPDAFSIPNPEEVNKFHRYDDTDTSGEAHHHTLGPESNQSAPGDHNHDGRNSKLLAGYVTRANISVGGSRSSGVALINLLTALQTAGVIKNDTVA